MQCCYYPTSIVAIDDDENFLKTFSQHLALPNCILYTSPEKAITDLQNQNLFEHLRIKLSHETTAFGNDPTSTSEQYGFLINIKELHEEIYSADRFKNISVMIVDYHMGDINGIDVCQKLSHVPIKKILLTGGADKEKVAIEAFNKGIIHRFVNKADSNFPSQLKQAITVLKEAYFKDLTNSLFPTTNIQLLRNPAFANFVRNLQDQINAIEYYLLDASGSFLFLNAQGEPTWLVVRNDIELNDFEIIAKDFDCDKKIIKAITERQQIPFFFSENDFKQPIEKWDSFLYTATPLPGVPGYFYAVINGNVRDNIDIKQLAGYKLCDS